MLQIVSKRKFFRKRPLSQELPCICIRGVWFEWLYLFRWYVTTKEVKIWVFFWYQNLRKFEKEIWGNRTGLLQAIFLKYIICITLVFKIIGRIIKKNENLWPCKIEPFLRRTKFSSKEKRVTQFMATVTSDREVRLLQMYNGMDSLKLKNKTNKYQGQLEENIRKSKISEI